MLPTVHYNMGGIPTNYKGEVVCPKVGACSLFQLGGGWGVACVCGINLKTLGGGP